MKCPRKNCEYDTATQPAANRSQQSELEPESPPATEFRDFSRIREIF
jgi:hypothetical protein